MHTIFREYVIKILIHRTKYGKKKYQRFSLLLPHLSMGNWPRSVRGRSCHIFPWIKLGERGVVKSHLEGKKERGECDFGWKVIGRNKGVCCSIYWLYILFLVRVLLIKNVQETWFLSFGWSSRIEAPLLSKLGAIFIALISMLQSICEMMSKESSKSVCLILTLIFFIKLPKRSV